MFSESKLLLFLFHLFSSSFICDVRKDASKSQKNKKAPLSLIFRTQRVHNQQPHTADNQIV